MSRTPTEIALEEANERLNRINQASMVAALATRFAGKALQYANEAVRLADAGQTFEACKMLGRAEGLSDASKLAGGIAKEL